MTTMPQSALVCVCVGVHLGDGKLGFLHSAARHYVEGLCGLAVPFRHGLAGSAFAPRIFFRFYRKWLPMSSNTANKCVCTPHAFAIDYSDQHRRLVPCSLLKVDATSLQRQNMPQSMDLMLSDERERKTMRL